MPAKPLRWRHNGRDGVSNHHPHDCLLNRLFGRRSKQTSKLRVTGLCEGNSPVTGEFPTQRASNAENVSIWWRHHANVNDNYTGTYQCLGSGWCQNIVSSTEGFMWKPNACIGDRAGVFSLQCLCIFRWALHCVDCPGVFVDRCSISHKICTQRCCDFFGYVISY